MIPWISRKSGNVHIHAESERGTLTWILQGPYLMVINPITIVTYVEKEARDEFSDAY